MLNLCSYLREALAGKIAKVISHKCTTRPSIFSLPPQLELRGIRAWNPRLRSKFLLVAPSLADLDKVDTCQSLLAIFDADGAKGEEVTGIYQGECDMMGESQAF